MTRTSSRGRSAARSVVPLLAGATAAAAGVLLLGWPHRPPLPGHAGLLAAAALAFVAVLLVFVPALPVWRRSDVVRDRLAAAAAAKRRRRPTRGPAARPVTRERADNRVRREAFEPAR